MNELFKKQTTANSLKEFVLAVYGMPTQPDKTNMDEAIIIATDQILMGVIERQEVQEQMETIYSSPGPYSTHDLALLAATNFFKQPEYIPHLRNFLMIALLQSVQWLQQGLVDPALVANFEKILCTLYDSDL